MPDKKNQIVSHREDFFFFFFFSVESYVDITETNSVCRQTEMKLTEGFNLGLKV